MGRSKKTAPPPTPKAPPPPAEDISAEVIAPTMRQEAARRARMGAYVTRGQKIGAGGQLIGASPIQLANVAAAAQAGRGEKRTEEKTLESFDPALTNRIKTISKMGNYGGSRKGQKMATAVAARKSSYEKYLKQRQKDMATRNKTISPEGGMVI